MDIIIKIFTFLFYIGICVSVLYLLIDKVVIFLSTDVPFYRVLAIGGIIIIFMMWIGAELLRILFN
jgi:hypothetical protein